MKKLIPLVLSLALLCSGSSAATVDRDDLHVLAPDLTGMSDDVLRSVISEASLLLFSRNLIDGVTVPPGTYTVGTDIPAGVYRVEVKAGTGLWEIYKDEANAQKKRHFDGGVLGEFYKVTQIGKLTLEPGNVIYFGNCTIVFYPYTGIVF